MSYSRSPFATAAQPEPQRWELDIDGATHVVLLGYGDSRARSFSIDGRQQTLGGRFPRGLLVARFDVAGRPTTLTMRVIRASLRVNWRRTVAMWRETSRRVWLATLGFLALVSALDTSGAGAVDAAKPVTWTIFSLEIDGDSAGSWVARQEPGFLVRWTFAAPGDPLPDADSDVWPRPRR